MLGGHELYHLGTGTLLKSFKQENSMIRFAFEKHCLMTNNHVFEEDKIDREIG